MNHKRNEAINLMIEDLHTIHTGIRCRAKGQNCEDELNSIKQELLDYLNLLKKSS